MQRLPQAFYRRLIKGDNPTVYITVQTHIAIRMYSGKQLNDFFDVTINRYDGSWLYDGSRYYGGGADYVGSKQPLILSFDRLQKTLAPRNNDLLSGFVRKQQSTFSVVLNNSDRMLGKLISSEPFITRPLSVYLGYDELYYTDHVKIFSGVIDEIELSKTDVTLTAVEI